MDQKNDLNQSTENEHDFTGFKKLERDRYLGLIQQLEDKLKNGNKLREEDKALVLDVLEIDHNIIKKLLIDPSLLVKVLSATYCRLPESINMIPLASRITNRLTLLQWYVRGLITLEGEPKKEEKKIPSLFDLLHPKK